MVDLVPLEAFTHNKEFEFHQQLEVSKLSVRVQSTVLAWKSISWRMNSRILYIAPIREIVKAPYAILDGDGDDDEQRMEVCKVKHVQEWETREQREKEL